MRSGTNIKTPTRTRGAREREREKTNDEEDDQNRRTLMMRNGRPYSSNARDMLELYYVCKLLFFRARLRTTCDGSSESEIFFKNKKRKMSKHKKM